MPNIDFEQTDVLPAFSVGVYCTGRSLSGGTNVSSQADEGASAGGEHLFTIAPGTGASPRVCVSFNILLPDEYDTIDAQTITIPLNITVQDSTGVGEWEEAFCCLLDSEGSSLSKLGEVLALNDSLVSIGVKTAEITVPETSYTTGQSLMFCLCFTNSSAMTQSTPRFTADQTITIALSGTPEPEPDSGVPVKMSIGLNLGIP